MGVPARPDESGDRFQGVRRGARRRGRSTPRAGALDLDGPGRVAVRYPPSDEVEVVEQVVRHCEDLA
ncbi:hypothetical protein [Actinomadura decatromicini]|uniref:Uncharacterized protein n=1 Tax=Actinomadura decatromicini TaxID=2604572 RepID=A0A5D3FTC2_9ACTN|nr:hypothetical protein [Actinomadura decatromicini]TYK51196.1 hypothetical protein FXF68_12295 [Actinomadura decatromicini]